MTDLRSHRKELADIRAEVARLEAEGGDVPPSLLYRAVALSEALLRACRPTDVSASVRAQKQFRAAAQRRMTVVEENPDSVPPRDLKACPPWPLRVFYSDDPDYPHKGEEMLKRACIGIYDADQVPGAGGLIELDGVPRLRRVTSSRLSTDIAPGETVVLIQGARAGATAGKATR